MSDEAFNFDADNKALTKTVIAKYPQGRRYWIWPSAKTMAG
jgi:hypothetical protein